MMQEQKKVEDLLNLMKTEGIIEDWAKCPGVPNYDLFLMDDTTIQIHIVQ